MFTELSRINCKDDRCSSQAETIMLNNFIKHNYGILLSGMMQNKVSGCDDNVKQRRDCSLHFSTCVINTHL